LKRFALFIVVILIVACALAPASPDPGRVDIVQVWELELEPGKYVKLSDAWRAIDLVAQRRNVTLEENHPDGENITDEVLLTLRHWHKTQQIELE
jgi:hypothetical protein